MIGWQADDSLYPCRVGSHTCEGGHLGNKKYRYLPNSAMNAMGPGWACAQRRPLRALAHVLWLYDPVFIVLVDDDTYVNYPLLVKRFGATLDTIMGSQPIVLGELMGRTGAQGHVSKGGFAVGGSGYILGKEALLRLHSYELAWLYGAGLPKYVTSINTNKYENTSDIANEDTQRSFDQMKSLSVLGEAYNLISQPSTEPCAQSERECIGPLVPMRRRHAHVKSGTRTIFPAWASVVPSKRRLVDICVSMMSGEHTCQHSDHVMGRCLLYGAHAAFINVACHSKIPLEEVPQSVPLGMCFMSQQCDIRSHITCHRYRPGISTRSAERHHSS